MNVDILNCVSCNEAIAIIPTSINQILKDKGDNINNHIKCKNCCFGDLNKTVSYLKQLLKEKEFYKPS